MGISTVWPEHVGAQYHTVAHCDRDIEVNPYRWLAHFSSAKCAKANGARSVPDPAVTEID
jgi:hypothetical protein